MTACLLCRIPRFLLKPREAFQEARNEPVSAAVFTIIPLVILFSVLFTAAGALLSPGILFWPVAPLLAGSGLLVSGATVAALLLAILVILVLCLVAILLNAAWLHLFVYALGGRRGLDQTVKAVCYAAIPVLLLGWIPLVGLLAGALWGILILITGIEVLQEMSGGRALAAAFLAWMAGFFLFAVLPLLFLLPVRVVTSGPLP